MTHYFLFLFCLTSEEEELLEGEEDLLGMRKRQERHGIGKRI